MSCLLLLPQQHPSYQTTKYHNILTVSISLLTSPAAASTLSSLCKDHLAAWCLRWQLDNINCTMPNAVLNIIVTQKTCKSVVVN
eukprot:12790348-Ditylum_brightwellii.AAC.1